MTNSSVTRGAQGLAATGLVFMNVCMYGYTVVAARLTSPAEFGAITALLGILLIGNVIPLGLQAEAARRLAVSPRNEHEGIVAEFTRLGVVLAVFIAVLVAALSPLITRGLRLDSAVPVLLAGLALMPLTLYGSLCGIEQGAERWRRLAVTYVSHGIARLGLGALTLTLWPSPTGALLGVALGTWLPVILGIDLYRLAPRRPLSHAAMAVFGSTTTLLAFFTLTNTDILISRTLFTNHLSGLYAAGIIVAKAAAFLPQFVPVVAYPILARATTARARLVSVSVVIAMGVAVTLGTWLLPRVVLILAGGPAYEGIANSFWIFALSGSMQAVLYMLIFDSLATSSTWVQGIVWAGVATLVVLALALEPGPNGLIALTATVIAATAGIVFVYAQVMTRRRQRLSA